MDIKGQVKVTKIKPVSEKLYVGTFYKFDKDNKGKYHTAFMPCKFVGQAIKGIQNERIMDKDLVEVEGFISVQEDWKDNEKGEFVATFTNIKRVS